MENLKHRNYKIENIDAKFLNNTERNRLLKIKNSLIELENDFIELKDGELKDRKLKIKKKIEELFFKSTIASIDDADRFGQKEMKVKRPWYNWLLIIFWREKKKKSCRRF